MNSRRNFRNFITKENKGSVTIEAAMIFPVLFFSLLLILYLGMVLYQQVKLQSLAIGASERGSVIYSARVKDMATGGKTLGDFLIRDPYRNVPFFDGGGKEAYTSIVSQYVGKNVGERDILKGTGKNSGGTVEVKDYLLEKRIQVRIQRDYQVPVASIPEMFGKKGPFSVDTTAVSVVADSPDFVRNVDIVLDITKQTEIFGTVQEGYQKIREAMDKVKDLLK